MIIRHAITAAHCICSKESADPDSHKKARCRSQKKSQIIQGKNEIVVFGGSMDSKDFTDSYQYRYPIKEAYVMQHFVMHTWTGSVDIGMVILTKPTAFFDQIALKTNEELQNTSPILPICLPVIDYELTHLDIHGVGWGLSYDESVDLEDDQDDISDRNPYYSSCMTNEVGPEQWRFRTCDIDHLRDSGWSCEKRPDFLPPDAYPYQQSNFAKCHEYFIRAQGIVDQKHINVMSNIDKIYVYRRMVGHDEKILCYRHNLLEKYGWCKVSENTERKDAWGFCSPSCSQIDMPVYLDYIVSIPSVFEFAFRLVK